MHQVLTYSTGSPVAVIVEHSYQPVTCFGRFDNVVQVETAGCLPGPAFSHHLGHMVSEFVLVVILRDPVGDVDSRFRSHKGDLGCGPGDISVGVTAAAHVKKGLAVAFDSLQANKTNEIMKVLTFFSTILLPLTFITGLYGMNVGLPFQDDPNSFFIVIVLMIIIVAIMIFYFKRKRWI